MTLAKKIILFLLIIFANGKNINLLAQDVKLVNFKASNCCSLIDYEKALNRVSNYEWKHDTLIIETEAWSLCCAKEFGNVKLNNDTIYLSNFSYVQEDHPLLIVDSIGDTILIEYFYVVDDCLCDCYYKLHFSITGLKPNQIYPVMLNNKLLPVYNHRYLLVEPKFELYKGDTINSFDHYGFRQGKHMAFDEKGRIISETSYNNDSIISGFSHRVFYRNGVVKSESIYQSANSGVINYYNRKGVLMSYCNWKYSPIFYDEPCFTL